MDPMHVLLAEDDPMIGDCIRRYLHDEGYAVDHLLDGSAVEALLAAQRFDLLLLDLGLPGRDGVELLAAVRRGGMSIPVIVLSARGATADRVACLDLGADDYLVKPFSLRELGARMRCTLRRGGGRGQPDIHLPGVCIDPQQRSVSLHGEPVALSEREYGIVEALAQRPGAVLSRLDLEERLYGWGGASDSNPVAVHIHTIRQKLGQDFIRTLRGVGYFIPGCGDSFFKQG